VISAACAVSVNAAITARNMCFKEISFVVECAIAQYYLRNKVLQFCDKLPGGGKYLHGE
jgi:hypothetical protein